MFDRDRFEQAVRMSRYTLVDLARSIHMNPSTLHRKMSGVSDFSRKEIQEIRDILHLDSEQVDRIFFADEVA